MSYLGVKVFLRNPKPPYICVAPMIIILTVSQLVIPTSHFIIIEFQELGNWKLYSWETLQIRHT